MARIISSTIFLDIVRLPFTAQWLLCCFDHVITHKFSYVNYSVRLQNGPVLGRTGSPSATDTLGDTPGSCRSAPALSARCRQDRTIRTLIIMYIVKNCPFKVRLWLSPLQQVTDRHTATPAAEMPTGDTHGGTWTPAALVRALGVTGSILPLCETRTCSDVICEEPRQPRRDSHSETHRRRRPRRCCAC